MIYTIVWWCNGRIIFPGSTLLIFMNEHTDADIIFHLVFYDLVNGINAAFHNVIDLWTYIHYMAYMGPVNAGDETM